jgi:hypothetical protein
VSLGAAVRVTTVLVASSDSVRTDPAPDFVVADVTGLVQQDVESLAARRDRW